MKDVIVIGGGPVGLVAAIHAARRGLSVTVLEPRGAPIDKACGEGIMPHGVRELDAIGVRPPGMPIHGIVYADERRSVRAPMRSGPGLGVRRTALHLALTEAARGAGVETLAAASSGVAIHEGRVEVSLGRTGELLRSRYVVAADGLHSPTRRGLGVDRPVGLRHKRFGLVTHARTSDVPTDVEVHWARDCELYVTPVSEDVVGLAVLSEARAPLSAKLPEFPSVLARVDRGSVEDRVLGAGPFRQRSARRVVGGRVLLVGDAAGYVDALTGEGLSLGFAQARLAIDSLVSGRVQGYEKAWRRTVREPTALTGGVLLASRWGPVRSGIVPAAVALPTVFEAIVNRLAGAPAHPSAR